MIIIVISFYKTMISLYLRNFIFLLISVSFCNYVVAQKDCFLEGDIEEIAGNPNIEAIILQFKSEPFTLNYNKNDIHSLLMELLNCEVENFSLANPDEHYVSGCMRVPGDTTPKRKILVYAESKEILALAYLEGGFGINTHIWVARYDRNRTGGEGNNIYIKNIWHGTTTTPRLAIASLDEFREAILHIYRSSD